MELMPTTVEWAKNPCWVNHKPYGRACRSYFANVHSMKLSYEYLSLHFLSLYQGSCLLEQMAINTDTQLVGMKDIRDRRVLVSKWDICITPSPLKAHVNIQKRKQKDLWKPGVELSRHNRVIAHKDLYCFGYMHRTKLAKLQHERGKDPRSSTHSYWQLMVTRKGRVSFLQGCSSWRAARVPEDDHMAVHIRAALNRGNGLKTENSHLWAAPRGP